MARQRAREMAMKASKQNMQEEIKNQELIARM